MSQCLCIVVHYPPEHASNLTNGKMDSKPTTERTLSGPIIGTATNLGIWGSARLFPGVTTLTCKCAEKDAQIASFQESITALSKDHASVISHLTEQNQLQKELRDQEHHRMLECAAAELEDRLSAIFAYLDERGREEDSSRRQAMMDLDSKCIERAQEMRMRDQALTAREEELKTRQIACEQERLATQEHDRSLATREQELRLETEQARQSMHERDQTLAIWEQNLKTAQDALEEEGAAFQGREQSLTSWEQELTTTRIALEQEQLAMAERDQALLSREHDL